MKKLGKILVTAGLTSSALAMLVSCDNNTATRENYHNDFYEAEEKVEAEILDEIKGTGSLVYVFDLKYIDVIKNDNEYYISLKGDIINDIQIGREEGNVIYEISKDSYELAESIKMKIISELNGGTILSKDSLAYQLYGSGIETLKDILEDRSTKLYSVYNNDKEELIYGDYVVTRTQSDTQSENE